MARLTNDEKCKQMSHLDRLFVDPSSKFARRCKILEWHYHNSDSIFMRHLIYHIKSTYMMFLHQVGKYRYRPKKVHGAQLGAFGYNIVSSVSSATVMWVLFKVYFAPIASILFLIKFFQFLGSGK